MTGRDFDALVNNPGCFAVIHGHVDDELDSVVGRNDQYVLVRPSLSEADERGAGVAAPRSDASLGTRLVLTGES